MKASMLGRVRKHDLMLWIMQKRRAAFHRAENPAFAFNPQRLYRDLLTCGDPEHQRLGLMGIQVIQDDVPLGGLRVAFNQTLEMCQAVFLRTGWSPRGFDYLGSRPHRS
jgi:hypothetical protein